LGWTGLRTDQPIQAPEAIHEGNKGVDLTSTTFRGGLQLAAHRPVGARGLRERDGGGFAKLPRCSEQACSKSHGLRYAP
jgi:hypothetical protein